ncbi:MAG: hypothetical protein MMC33_003586 [Icmadophila ericetorum]|nr:hypothetical protein [Icmadophila ericetorum]
MGTRDLGKGGSALKSMGAPSNVTPLQLDITQDLSIDAAFEHIKSTYGKLDILINNAGTAGRDIGVTPATGALPPGVPLREVYEHVYRVNLISAGVLTEKMVPLLEKSALPKIVFISSVLGSLNVLHDGAKEGKGLVPLPWYSISKAAVNHFCMWYARRYPTWKVNACCPGLVSMGLNRYERNEENDPKFGAINVCRLVMEGEEGGSGAFSDRFQTLP